jgi:hypothetical protein
MTGNLNDGGANGSGDVDWSTIIPDIEIRSEEDSPGHPHRASPGEVFHIVSE